MKLSNLFAVTAAALVSVEAIPNPAPNDGTVVVTGLAKRAQTNAVTGTLKGYSGTYRVQRMEIRNFVNDKGGMTLNLFLLALQRMQGLSKGNWNSYWELAGIHGRPFHGWNGEGASGNGNAGYCTHGSTLFPTWHRPYLAYYEQIIYMNAEQVVKQVPSSRRKKWSDALGHMRLPYWDWATNDAQMPDILTRDQVYLEKPDGSRGNIRNPLFSNYFKSGTFNDRGLFPADPMFRWSHTLRFPNSDRDQGASSQNWLVNNDLRDNSASLRQRVYQLLLSGQYSNWAAFSNKEANVNAPDSLESIHDAIHGIVGHNGHMSYVEYSSFDPIFWLHHANIDRLFAIWQALHPDKWVSGQRNGGGTFGVPPNTWEDANTPLTPFRGANGRILTSNNIRDTSVLGYGYAETPKYKYSNQPVNYKKFVTQRVNALYGSTNRAMSQAAKKRKRDIAVDPSNSTAVAIDKSVQNHQYYDWKVNFIVDKTALGGSFFVRVFLGDPSPNPKDWSTQKEHVGDYVVFTSAMASAPGIDPSTINTLVSGSVPLTQALIDSFKDTGLESLYPADVSDFLKQKLQWRVSLMNDTSYTVDKVAGLEASVSAAVITVPDDDEDGTIAPDFGEYVNYPDIIGSIGKTGGQ